MLLSLILALLTITVGILILHSVFALSPLGTASTSCKLQQISMELPSLLVAAIRKDIESVKSNILFHIFGSVFNINFVSINLPQSKCQLKFAIVTPKQFEEFVKKFNTITENNVYYFLQINGKAYYSVVKGNFIVVRSVKFEGNNALVTLEKLDSIYLPDFEGYYALLYSTPNYLKYSEELKIKLPLSIINALSSGVSYYSLYQFWLSFNPKNSYFIQPKGLNLNLEKAWELCIEQSNLPMIKDWFKVGSLNANFVVLVKYNGEWPNKVKERDSTVGLNFEFSDTTIKNITLSCNLGSGEAEISVKLDTGTITIKTAEEFMKELETSFPLQKVYYAFTTPFPLAGTISNIVQYYFMLSIANKLYGKNVILLAKPLIDYLSSS